MHSQRQMSMNDISSELSFDHAVWFCKYHASATIHCQSCLTLFLQEMLEDREDAVAALAIDCIALMCEADALDFYKAWPIVWHIFPTLPKERPLVAKAWVALLTHGQLDVKAFPEKAAALIDLLWIAAKDPMPQVGVFSCRACLLLFTQKAVDLPLSKQEEALSKHGNE